MVEDPDELAARARNYQVIGIHEDPYGRFIIATARLDDLTLVTGDETLEKYGLTIIR